MPEDSGTITSGTKVPLILLVGGMDKVPPFVKAQQVQVALSRNKSTHVIHLSGKYDSHALMP